MPIPTNPLAPRGNSRLGVENEMVASDMETIEFSWGQWSLKSELANHENADNLSTLFCRREW